MTLKIGNMSPIYLAKNITAHGRNKHIEMRFHYLKELVSEGKFKLEHCKSEYQVADLLKKSMTTEVFEIQLYARQMLDIMS